MNQKSSFREVPQFVSQVLTANSIKSTLHFWGAAKAHSRHFMAREPTVVRDVCYRKFIASHIVGSIEPGFECG
jgi:hypothetical protein